MIGILAGLFVCQVGAYWFPISSFFDLTPYALWYAGNPFWLEPLPVWVVVILNAQHFHDSYGWLMALGLIILGAMVWTGRLDRIVCGVGRTWGFTENRGIQGVLPGRSRLQSII